MQERGLSAVDFGLFALCGAVGCTSTHTTVVPLDVVKTRLQTNPGRYEGLTQGVVTIAREVMELDVGSHVEVDPVFALCGERLRQGLIP